MMLLRNKRFALLVFVVLTFALVPEVACANDVAGYFKSPLNKMLELLSGTIAGLIVALAVAVAGIAYIINKDDLSGWVFNLVKVAIGGVIIYASAHIGNWFLS